MESPFREVENDHFWTISDILNGCILCLDANLRVGVLSSKDENRAMIGHDDIIRHRLGYRPLGPDHENNSKRNHPEIARKKIDLLKIESVHRRLGLTDCSDEIGNCFVSGRGAGALPATVPGLTLAITRQPQGHLYQAHSVSYADTSSVAELRLESR